MKIALLACSLAALPLSASAQALPEVGKPPVAEATPTDTAERKLETIIGEALSRQGFTPPPAPPHAGTKGIAGSRLVRPQATTREELQDLAAGQTATGVIVRFSDPAIRDLAEQNLPPPAEAIAAIQAASPLPLAYHRAMAGGRHVFRFDEPQGADAANELVRGLSTLPITDLVEADIVVRRRGASSDPRYGEQWNLRGASQGYAGGIDVEPAWDATHGWRKAVVAVLDTGVLRHPEFSSRLLKGYDFVSDVKYSNDGDGRDSDATDPGDWAAAGECGPGEPATNSSWHGTHVTGIIAANGANGSGVAGVAWDSLILPVRVLGKCGGDSSDIADAIRWAAGLNVPGAPRNNNPAQIINLSLGGFSTPTCPSVYQEAIDAAVGQGALVVVAAGNEATDAAYSVPANCKQVLTVVALDPYGEYAVYTNSNLTGRIPNVIAAPGGDTEWYGPSAGILSTAGSGVRSPGSMTWGMMEGTSMAAPHVAGIAALALAKNNKLVGSELLSLLRLSATPFPEETACAVYGRCGSGIASASRTVAAAAAFADYQLVYEFYNTQLDHYFRTGGKTEAAGIHKGAAGPGWSETFDYFYAWSRAVDGAVPVCRFYGTPGKGPNSHFYTASAEECELVKSQDPGWTYEGIAFYAKLPVNGECPAGTKPVYRAYNNRWMFNDSNHRYTTDAGIYHSMVAQGWAGEGVALCAAM